MTIRKTFTVTEKQDQWIKARIASGDYASEGEYLRDLIRRDQHRGAAALRAAIQEGLDSGLSERTVAEIWSEAEAR